MDYAAGGSQDPPNGGSSDAAGLPLASMEPSGRPVISGLRLDPLQVAVPSKTPAIAAVVSADALSTNEQLQDLLSVLLKKELTDVTGVIVSSVQQSVDAAVVQLKAKPPIAPSSSYVGITNSLDNTPSSPNMATLVTSSSAVGAKVCQINSAFSDDRTDAAPKKCTILSTAGVTGIATVIDEMISDTTSNEKDVAQMTTAAKNRATVMGFRSRAAKAELDMENYRKTIGRDSTKGFAGGILSMSPTSLLRPASIVPANTVETLNVPAKPKFNIMEYLRKLVQTTAFDVSVASLVTLNAVVIGIQSDWIATHTSDDLPGVFRGVELTFCTIFTFEIALRLFVFRCSLFTMAGWKWNVFDVLVVALQLLEELLVIIFTSTTQGGTMPSLSSMRALKILRLLRVLRAVRIMHLIGELRTLIVAIASSLKALFWTMVLIAMLLYITSVLFTQLVSDYRVDLIQRSGTADVELTGLFGSIGDTALTLFQSVTGGISWREVSFPLGARISPMLTFIFVVYVAFMILALMNVVTGIFVDSAITKTKEQSDIYMMNNVRELFGDSETMNWAEFNGKLELPEMISYFEFLDVDQSDARALFTLIDTDFSGCINREEFLNSCLRLRGPAKALDHQVLVRQIYDMETMMRDLHKDMEKRAALERQSRTSCSRSQSNFVDASQTFWNNTLTSGITSELSAS